MEKKKSYRKQIYIGVSMLCMVVAMMFFAFHVAANDARRKTIEIPSYSAEARDTLIKEQRAKGFLYAGMTTIENDYTRDAAVKTPKDGETYYAKFIPEEILSIKAQVSEKIINEEVLNVSEKSSIRFVTSIDSLEYRYLGFRIQRGDGAVSNKQTTANVYAKLRAMVETQNGEQWLDYTPAQVFEQEDSKYFKIWTINNVPQNHFNTDITVRPYYVTFDNVEVVGVSGIKTVNLGRSWIYVDDNTTGVQSEKYDTNTYADLQDATQIGTYNAPFKDIQEAVDYMNMINPTKTVEPVILIKNLVEDSGNDDEDVYEPYKISKDISITRTLTLTSANPNASVNEPDINHLSTVKMNAVTQNGMFVVQNKTLSSNATTVRVKALTLDGGSSQTAENIRAVMVGAGATLKLDENATVQNFNSNINGAAVYVNGTLEVDGGTIKNNKTTTNGGNVYINNGGTLNMTSGTISGGTSVTSGGNIAAIGSSDANRCNITITGGTISAGKTTGANDNLTGVGGNIYLDYATLSVTKATIEGGVSEQSRGGNIYIRKNSTVELNQGCTVNGGSAPANGGSIMADTKPGITIKIDGATVQNGSTSNGEGGNIRMGLGTLEIVKGKVSGGTAGASGGNIYLADNAQLTTSGDANTEISGGTARSGGNIYTVENLNISNENISGGNATNGGNICVGSGAILTISGTGINNVVNDTEITTNVTNGGHVYSEGTVSITESGRLVGGKATNGGNLYLASTATLSIEEGAKITEGTAVKRGDALGRGGNVYTQANLTIQNQEISGGNADRGGNVYVAKDTTLTVDGTGISNVVNETEIATVVDQGGHIYSEGTVTITSNGSLTTGKANNGGNIALNSTGTLTMKNGSTIRDGVAWRGGGNIFAYGDSAHNKETNKLPFIEINGGTVSDGVAKTEGDTELGTGGNIYAKYATVKLTNNARVEDGIAGRNGGNIFAIGCEVKDQTGETINAYGVELTLDNQSTITGGHVLYPGGNAYGIGGNVFMTHGDLDVTNATISDGESEQSRGGNIYMRINATLNVNAGGFITGGKAASHGGNIMAEKNCNIYIKGGTVSGGTSTGGSGGNIRMGSGTLEVIEGGSISGGTAIWSGGNIDASGTVRDGVVADSDITKVIVNDGTISNGRAIFKESENDLEAAEANGNGRGGNIFVKYGDLTLTSAVIYGGQATTMGGNICVNGRENRTSTVTIKDSEIYNGYSRSIVENSNYHGIAGNIYMEYGNMSVLSSTIYDGIASSRGGNIYIRRNSTLTIDKKENGTISLIQTGSAGMNGGNIMAEKDSTITLQGGSKITGGTAGNEGGNIKLTVGTLNLVDGSITNGTAVRGGNILADGTTVWGTTDHEGDVEEGGAAGEEGDVGETSTGETGGSTTNGKTGVKIEITNGTISGGKASRDEGTLTTQGGNIYIRAGKLIMNGGTINGANEQGNITNGEEGGNIYAIGGTLEEQNTQVPVTITLTNGTIQNGNVSKFGGNIYLGDGTLTMNSSNILSGSATSSGSNANGGNVYIASGGTFTMNSGSVEAGVCTNFGGNIYTQGGSIEMTGGTINGELSSSTTNKITENAVRGGNIYIQNGTMNMSGGTVTNGDAMTSGGNIHVETKDSTTIISRITMTGGTISDGRVTASDVTEGTSINETGSGGNIFMDKSAMVMGFADKRNANAKITGGQSLKSRGGNIYMNNASTLTMYPDTEISGGTAHANGGNVMLNNADCKLHMCSVFAYIKNGYAGGQGGNIFLSTKAILSLAGSEITGGTSGGAGGNVYCNKGYINLDTNTNKIIGGKKKNGTDSNLCIGKDSPVIQINADLKTDSKIYITTEVANIVFAKAESAKIANDIKNSECFVPDVEGKNITLSGTQFTIN